MRKEKHPKKGVKCDEAYFKIVEIVIEFEKMVDFFASATRAIIAWDA